MISRVVSRFVIILDIIFHFMRSWRWCFMTVYHAILLLSGLAAGAAWLTTRITKMPAKKKKAASLTTEVQLDYVIFEFVQIY